MISVFLVEDEVYALRALQQKIIDLQEDYVIAGTADNGASALEQIPAKCPDIIITDIRMPDMDGLTLLQKLKDIGCPSLPVIVSGYQEFDYAKQAVKLGVADYLLKPVGVPELRECLASCAKRLKNQHKNIISFMVGDDTLSFEAAFGQDIFTVIYAILANPLSTVDNMLHPNVRYIPNIELEEMLEYFCRGQFLRCFDGFFTNEKVILLGHEKKNAPPSARNLELFAQSLAAKSGENVTLFHTVTERQGLAAAVRQCRSGAIRNLVLGQTGVYASVPPHQRLSPDNLSETVDLYAMLLSQNQPELLRSNIRRLFGSWSASRRTYPAVRDDLVFLVDSLKRKFSIRKSMDFDSLYFIENIISFSKNDGELADNFCQLLEEMFTLPETGPTSGEELVNTVVSYFGQHLKSNVTLQDLENETGLSKVYICRVFKKAKGVTPIDYFTHLKIAKATEMLQQFPDLSLREISDALGFSDVYYFSKVFKKITGNPPSKLREAREG